MSAGRPVAAPAQQRPGMETLERRVLLNGTPAGVLTEPEARVDDGDETAAALVDGVGAPLSGSEAGSSVSDVQVMAAEGGTTGVVQVADAAQVLTQGLQYEANQPIGVAQGLHPGRVTWVHDPRSTSWDGSSGHWWDDSNTDQVVVNEMLSKSIRWLAGEATDADAWDAIFHHFNRTHHGQDVGYASGEKIAIKVNMNNAWGGYGDADDQLDASPHLIIALVQELVEEVGVAPGDITVFDASRPLPDRFYNPVHSAFPGVQFVDRYGQYGRTQVQPDTDSQDLIRLSGASRETLRLPTCVTGAKYFINVANLKKHDIAGMTMIGKNLFGCIMQQAGGSNWEWSPSNLHGPVNGDNPMGSYNPLVDLMGHKHTGGKGLLYVIDGLYGAFGCCEPPRTWSTFDSDWPSSLFLSQDPMAVDSVALDFLRAETSVKTGTENYLHEGALANNPASGTTYDPEGDGSRLASLGVHEHWDDATSKRYTRNLGTGDGIELISADAVIDANDLAPGRAGDGNAEQFLIIRNGADVRVWVRDGTMLPADPSVLVLNRPLGDVSSITVDGSSDSDMLMVDFSGGDPIPPGGIDFRGGLETTGPGDALRLEGGTFGTITHNLDAAGAGSIELDGPGDRITYTGLEPIDDRLIGTTRILDFGAGNDTDVRLFDPDTADSSVRIEAPSNAELVDMNTTGMTDLVVNLGAGTDEIEIERLESGFGAAIEVNGQDDGDTLLVDFSQGLVRETIEFNGGFVISGDVLRLVGDPQMPIARTTYQVGATRDAGTWTVDPDGNMGAGLVNTANGDELVIAFTGLEPIDDVVPAGNLDLFLSNTGVDLAQIVDGPTVGGFVTNELSNWFGTPTFETVRFANKTNVTINPLDGVDQILVDIGTAAAGLSRLDAYGNELTGGAVNGDDDIADLLSVRATPAGLTTRLLGQGGDDLLKVGTSLNLDDVLGPVELVGGETGESTGDQLEVLDTNGTPDVLITQADTTISGMGPAAVTYSEGESLRLDIADGGPTTLDVLSTPAGTGTTAYLTGAGFSATVTVGSRTADFRDGRGDMDLIQGAVGIMQSGGTITVQIDDTGDADSDTVSIYEIPGATTVTAITGLGPGAVVCESGAIAALEIAAGGGGNTIDVNAASATSSVTIRTGGGADTVNVAALAGTAPTPNLAIYGEAGSDVFNVAPSTVTWIGLFGDTPPFPSGAGDALTLMSIADVTDPVVTDNGDGTGDLASTSHQDVVWQEIEELAIHNVDFGDAPAPYPTLLAFSGAWHAATGPRLGANRDTESDGQPSVLADGDDNNGTSSDEDGVTAISTVTVGQTGAWATVNVQNAPSGAKLDAWIDLDASGSWDADEKVADDVSVTNGDNTLTFDVPVDAALGYTYARFRLSTAGGLTPTGGAPDGEVEDYLVEILGPGGIRGTKWNDLDGDGVKDDGEPGLEGWTIYLDGGTSTLTDGDGNYSFTDLAPGTYTVTEEARDGWQQTVPGPGGMSDGPHALAFEAAQNVQAGGSDIQVDEYSVPWMVDWNNDGPADLLVGEKTATGLGKVRVYLNVGTASSPAFDGFSYVQAGGADLAVPAAGCLGVFPGVCDWDGDGRKDLLLGLADGRVQTFLNVNTDADPTFGTGDYVQVGEPGAKADLDVGLRATLDVVDWDNDTRADLVVGALDGKVRVYLDEAPAGAPDFRTERIVQDGAADLRVPTDRSSVAVTDLDGDGRKDLVLGNTAGHVYLYQNVGSDDNPAFAGGQALQAGGTPIDLPGTPRSRPFVCDCNGDGAADLLVGAADGLVRLYARSAQAQPLAYTIDLSPGELREAVDFGNWSLEALDDAYTTDEDGPRSVAGPGVLGNDLGAVEVTGVDRAGMVGLLTEWNADGSFTYDPNGGFEHLGTGQTAEDTFTYTVTDGQGGTDEATVTITVTGVNDAPMADAGGSQDQTDTDENGHETISLDASASSDPEGIAQYRWMANGEEIAFGSDPIVNVDLPIGRHWMTLTIFDTEGASDTDDSAVDVWPAPTAGGPGVLANPVAACLHECSQPYRLMWTGGDQARRKLWELGPTGLTIVADENDIPITQRYHDWPVTDASAGWHTFILQTSDGGPTTFSHSPSWLHVREQGGGATAMQMIAPVPSGAESAGAAEAAVLTWLSPASGEAVERGDTFELRWEVEIPAGDLLGDPAGKPARPTASLWVSGGATEPWTLTADDLAVDSGRYVWDTTGVASGEYRFGIRLADGGSWTELIPSDWLEVL